MQSFRDNELAERDRDDVIIDTGGNRRLRDLRRALTPTATVVISGDTRVCDEIHDLGHGADVLVHQACRATAMAPLISGTPLWTIFDDHADTIALGRLAADLFTVDIP